MKKIRLESSDWDEILFGGTGLPVMEQEIKSYIKQLAIKEEVEITLNVGGHTICLLKYDLNSEKFLKKRIE